MKIEPIQTGDEAQIKVLLRECGLPYEDLSAEHWMHFRVVRDRGSVVGVIGLEVFGRSALLRSLAVQVDQRKRGIASRLTSEAEATARVLGVESMYLLTTTAEDFFARRGYHRVDRQSVPDEVRNTAEFRELCPASAVCLLKEIGASG